MATRMKEKYTTEIAPALLKKFGYKSVMQIPKLDRPEAHHHQGPEVRGQL